MSGALLGQITGGVSNAFIACSTTNTQPVTAYDISELFPNTVGIGHDVQPDISQQSYLPDWHCGILVGSVIFDITDPAVIPLLKNMFVYARDLTGIYLLGMQPIDTTVLSSAPGQSLQLDFSIVQFDNILGV